MVKSTKRHQAIFKKMGKANNFCSLKSQTRPTEASDSNSEIFLKRTQNAHKNQDFLHFLSNAWLNARKNGKRCTEKRRFFICTGSVMSITMEYIPQSASIASRTRNIVIPFSSDFIIITLLYCFVNEHSRRKYLIKKSRFSQWFS